MADKTHHRVRSIYLSSENIPEYTSSDRVNIYLGSNVAAEEGYDLAYGIRSLGFNSTAFNISEGQKNNRLVFRRYVDQTYVTRVVQYDYLNNVNTHRDLTADQRTNLPTSYTDDIIVPDGHYTFEDLLAYLSDSDLTVISSGFVNDPAKDWRDQSNMIQIEFSWTATVGGFTIGLKNAQNTTPTRLTDPLTAVDYDIRNYSPFLQGVSIEPHIRYPGLFDILFTNFNSTVESIPISTPPSVSRRGLNPPAGIYFHMAMETDIVTPVVPAVLAEVIPFSFTGNITELGNETIYDTALGIFPSKYKTSYYTAYSRPRLEPVYVDISISLPNPSIDERGHRNILSRIFTLGSDKGNTSMFQYWDTPKMNVLDGISSFNNIQLEFSSESDRWNFFNLEFSIELYVCEYLIENVMEFMKSDVEMPQSDPISDASMQTGGTPLTPLPTSHFNYHTSGIHNVKRTRFH